MYNSILESRKFENGVYQITLRISEDDYFSVYDALNEKDAAALLENYLKYRADDGRPENISLKYNKNEHMVTIQSDLHYLGNNKTEDMLQAHKYISNSPENRH
ncbi:MAG TPA: hypothetical protein GX505_11365 [Clostridiales bacterium]|nr:hypothetical protein [Clostridiales bacterium]